METHVHCRVITSRMDPRIVSALRRLDEEFKAPLTVAALAQPLSLSPSRFAHLFAKEVGMSPMRYLHTQRMIQARLLLEQTLLSVKEVMVQVGCSDASHFARDFQRFHGLPPTQWRAAVRAGLQHPLASRSGEDARGR
jgi:AraC family transcriptional regulator, arabinose operon regulatory protein